MKNFTPYLLFDGNCAEALEFYKSVFGGEVMITKVSDSTIKDQMPKEKQDMVVFAKLTSGALEFLAGDWMQSGQKPQQGNTVCLHIECETEEQLKKYFNKLAVNAEPTLMEPISEQFFGLYGSLIDKYGIRWMFRKRS